MRLMARAGKRDDLIRQLALELVEDIPEHDSAGEVAALFRFVQRQIRYTGDTTGTENLSTPREILADGAGECKKKSILLCALLEAIGYHTRFAALAFDAGAPRHVIAEVATPGGWQSLDATQERPMGWRPPGVYRQLIIYNAE